MDYNEWRDELKNNLLNVSDAERKHVLDYYAEAYADRRDAGYSEDEIIKGFGVPYDASKRILDSAEDEIPTENSEISEQKKEQNGGAKFVIKIILWALLSLILIGFCCSQFIYCIEKACSFVAYFAAGEGLYGLTILGDLLMRTGILIMFSALPVMCVRKIIRNVKNISEDKNENL